MYDIVIINGTIPDFSTMTLKKSNIGIGDGKIAGIFAPEERVEGKLIVNAEGNIVSPGFIDLHMHEENFQEEGEKYVISKLMLQMGVTTCLGGNCGVQHQSVKLFRKTLEKLGGAPVNYRVLVGYNQLRKQVQPNGHEPITKEQRQELVLQIKDELSQGAFGLSFGLEYDRGIALDEVLDVLNAIDDPDLFVSIHYREDCLEAIDEMIEIALHSNKNVQISHLSSGAALGFMAEALDHINSAMKENPKLNFDTYPYAAFSTFIGSDAFYEGCFERWGKDYGDILLTNDPYKNIRCTKELYEKVRREYPDMLAVAFVMNENEIVFSMNNSNGMIASDGIIRGGKGHPRAAGTFPRVFGKYVREQKVLTMMEALKKTTLLPAQRLKFMTKGKIKEGFDADIVIFDPETIIDGATFETLEIAPKGIEYVIVDGKVSLEKGKIVNETNGRFYSG